MLLNTPSLTIILSPSWIGSFLLAWGVATSILTVLEKTGAGDEYQEIVTIVLLLIITGYVVASYSMDTLKIIGAVSLSIAVGRAFALLINMLVQLI